MGSRNNQVLLIGYLQRKSGKEVKVPLPQGEGILLQMDLYSRVPQVEGDYHRVWFGEWQSLEVRELLRECVRDPEVRVIGTLFSRKDGGACVIADTINFLDCSSGQRQRIADRLRQLRRGGAAE